MGGALGLAILSTIASTRTSGEVGVSAARAVTNGFDLAFAVAAVFCAAAIVVAATKLRPRKTSDVVTLPERIEIEEGEALAA